MVGRMSPRAKNVDENYEQGLNLSNYFPRGGGMVAFTST
jgi:hypothetical protein